MEAWLSTTIVIVAGFLTLFNFVDKLIAYSNKAKEPYGELERRVAELEQKDFDKRIAELEKGTRITQKAILALLKHSIDGNNTNGLKESEKELSEYLLNK